MDETIKNEVISTIKQNHPQLYKAAKSYVFFDKRVKKFFDDFYGADNIQSIIKLNEYFKELENVRQGNTSDSNLSKLAQKSNQYFNKYTEQGFLLAQEVGTANALTFTDILEDYLMAKTL
jgi:hypothetical protein